MGEEDKKQEEVTGTPAPQPEAPAPQPEAPAPEAPSPQPEAPAPNVAVQPPQVNLTVDPGTAMNITVQEYDKKITESEAATADLKKQKAAYIYDTNVQILLAQAQEQQKHSP